MPSQNHLLDEIKVSIVSGSATAGTSAINSSIIDMQGWDGVIFLAVFGDVTATSVLGLAVQENDANSGTGMTTYGSAAAFTAGASDADDKALAVDHQQPNKRYLRAALTRTTANAVVNCILAIQYKGRTRPTTQVDIINAVKNVRPAA